MRYSIHCFEIACKLAQGDFGGTAYLRHNNEVILRSKPNREPMDFERLKFLCYFIAGLIGEVFGFGLVLVIGLSFSSSTLCASISASEIRRSPDNCLCGL